ncbi:fungal specific transcription factor [Blastomyces dermatitidis ER-3]|uniref:Fungal specific transcription factor n=2 Tax=Ajellomyces dermatitidis (strain ER-3 / ATCC MYA-2586) TaxID=559297 RepID=A0ABP2EK73_AJEDR|nr:fungal specific transcription factor [Blastomyces dermatitidis ER-3]EEQ83543.1 fungal specific transcription factor [Blastomyces dermatitidis ER-3]
MTSTFPAGDAALHAVSGSSSNNGGGDAAKRKAEPNSGTHTRTKRNRYISLACNECKRRKIKCNGQVPCQRCGHLSLECLYAPNCCTRSIKDSEEFRSMKEHIETLQDQVNTLFANINELYQKTDSSAVESNAYGRELSRSLSQPSYDSQNQTPPRPRSNHPRFHGPTSTTFNLHVAKSSLQTMGITPAEDGNHDLFAGQDATPVDSPPPQQQQLPPIPQLSAHPNKDPLWVIKREEAIRLCRVYEREIGIMYPLLDIERLITHTNLLFTFLEAASRTGFTRRFKPGPDMLTDDDTCILKMVLAITLIVEGNGQSALGIRLFTTTKQRIEMKLWEPTDLRTIQLFALMATYHFHTDEDNMAYRFIGHTTRMCLELGLHRRDGMFKVCPNEADIPSVAKLFWSVYCLDRRWSFGMGLPFIIQDEDIDSSLPEPDDSVPYLKAMISYCRIGSKIWYSGLGSVGTVTAKREVIGFLDYQVLQWLKNVPENLRFYSPEHSLNGDGIDRETRRLRVLLYIRGNHMRILIYRPVLHSTSGILENMGYAETVVDIAKDTIRVLAHLNQTSDIYRSHQMLFNYFLVSALAVLLLAVSHAPAEFNRQVRDEFYMALDLVKGFSAKSYVSKRLWKMIKGLRGIGEKLGLLNRPAPPDPNDPHSTAAVAMAGLAGHPMDVMAVYRDISASGELGNSPQDGVQMSNELTHLFEAVGGYGGFLAQTNSAGDGDGINGEMVNAQGDLTSAEGLGSILGNEAEFARIMRDVF